MTREEADDQYLMAEVAMGSEPAFRELAGRHAGWALGLAGRLVGNPADAEDVVQEAMLRVWINAPQWRPEAAFKTWFYRVVVNLAIDWRRRKPLRPLADAGEPADPRPDPQSALAQGQAADQVAAAVADLPDRQRAALVLSYYEGVGNSEVASLLGVSVGAVEGLLVRARRTLRERLAHMLKD
jgi:RNA polymerase sigma-70 factor (ECF subfamily)